MTMQFYTKHVYGKPLEYLANQEDCKTLVMLTGQQTLTARTKTALNRLGVEFEEVLLPK